MVYSDAQKEATARYNKKAYDFISVVVPKGKRKRISDYAASQGKSMNRFINDAIDALRAGKAEFLGCILNDMSHLTAYSAGYGYGYGYYGYGYGKKYDKYGYGHRSGQKQQ